MLSLQRDTPKTLVRSVVLRTNAGTELEAAAVEGLIAVRRAGNDYWELCSIDRLASAIAELGELGATTTTAAQSEDLARQLVARLGVERDAQAARGQGALAGRWRSVDAVKRLEAEAGELVTLAGLARRLALAPDIRGATIEAAADISGVRVVRIWEPAGSELTVTASTGVGLGGQRAALDPQGAPVAAAYTSGQALLMRADPPEGSVDQEFARTVGAASLLYQPIVDEQRVMGVLELGWGGDTGAPGDAERRIVTSIAEDAAIALRRAELVERLAVEARTDELTGLANRRMWNEELPRELTRAAQFGHAVSVAMLDLDHFKSFNDRHGHAAGDAALRDVAQAWSRKVREIDVLVRYGGEEFALLLPGAGTEEAAIALERLLTATPHDLTVSIGIAEWRGSESVAELVARADASLYDAKRAGRARIVAAPAEPAEELGPPPRDVPARRRGDA